MPPRSTQPPGPRRRIALIALLAAVAAAAALALGLFRGEESSGPPGRATVPATAPTAPTTTPTGGTAASASAFVPRGMGTITLDRLPPQARETLRLIEAGGPFPYDKDGDVFANRERLLPARPTGYYREYTVVTPGSPDRGARRIVTGREGERYWTADHYASFQVIVP